MNLKLVEELYTELNKLSDGTDLYKMDLHIHTPASKCYKKTYKDEEEEYVKIVDKALENDIKIIAITDHNTFDGYFKLCKIISKRYDLQKRYKDILILPGVEISNFGKHYLAIFENVKEINNDKLQEKLGMFLTKIGIDIDERGRADSDAINVTPIQLLKEINASGGISILAHADANNGLLEKLLHKGENNYFKEKENNSDWLESGKSVAKIITSEYLTAISLHDSRYERKLEKELLNSKAYIRKNDIGILYCSDSHSVTHIKGASGGQIGENYSYIKLTKLSFEGLKLALLDPKVRIFNKKNENTYPYIYGLGVKGGFLSQTDEFVMFKFHKQLNCIIGARGTGKSTILNIIQYTLWNEKTKGNVCQFEEAIVYLKIEKECYAVYVKPRVNYDSYTKVTTLDTNKKVIYHKKNNSKFINISIKDEKVKEIILKSFTSYKQKDIYNYASEVNGIKHILNNLLKLQNIDALYTEKRIESNLITTIQKVLGNHNELIEFEDFLDKLDSYSGEYDNEIVKTYISCIDKQTEINKLYLEMSRQINNSIGKHVKISSHCTLCTEREMKSVIDYIGRKLNSKYENKVWLRKILTKVIYLANKNQEWYFWIYILKNDSKSIINKYKLTEEETTKLIRLCRKGLTRRNTYVLPKVIIDFEYNVNMGMSNKCVFRNREQLSLGQRAVAMLLVIIKAANDLGDNRPLIIDQPEDDLDNVYIYSSLVKHFREVKEKRQLIFATHNANIPISGDAENILIMDSDGEQGFLKLNGSIDRQDICRKVLEILEGGIEALGLRMSKYKQLIK